MGKVEMRGGVSVNYTLCPVSPSLGSEYKKRKLSVVQITSFSVRMVRLELTQANAHYPLKVACLPFHHIRR